MCNIVRRNQKETGQSQAEMGTIGHSAMDIDSTIASDNRKIQEPSGVEMLWWVILQITPKATARGDGKVPPHLKSPSS